MSTTADMRPADTLGHNHETLVANLDLCGRTHVHGPEPVLVRFLHVDRPLADGHTLLRRSRLTTGVGQEVLLTITAANDHIRGKVTGLSHTQ